MADSIPANLYQRDCTTGLISYRINQKDYPHHILNIFKM
jgi:hypothetical protein